VPTLVGTVFQRSIRAQCRPRSAPTC